MLSVCWSEMVRNLHNSSVILYTTVSSKHPPCLKINSHLTVTIIRFKHLEKLMVKADSDGNFFPHVSSDAAAGILCTDVDLCCCCCLGLGSSSCGHAENHSLHTRSPLFLQSGGPS